MNTDDKVVKIEKMNNPMKGGRMKMYQMVGKQQYESLDNNKSDEKVNKDKKRKRKLSEIEEICEGEWDRDFRIKPPKNKALKIEMKNNSLPKTIRRRNAESEKRKLLVKRATNNQKQPKFNTHNVSQPYIKQYFCPIQSSHKTKQSQDKNFSLARSSSVQAHPTPPVPSPSVNLDESMGKFLKKSK